MTGFKRGTFKIYMTLLIGTLALSGLAIGAVLAMGSDLPSAGKAVNGYSIAYSNIKGNTPTAASSGYEATDRYTTIHFEGLVPGENGGYVGSLTSGEHYFYNLTPISGITSVTISATGDNFFFSASYSQLDLASVKGANRPDLSTFTGFATGANVLIDVNSVPSLSNCRYFLFWSDSDSVCVNSIGVSYSCDSSSLVDPGTDLQTNWKSNEISAFETVLGSGNAIPFIGKSMYFITDDDGFVVLWPHASSSDITAYSSLLASAGYTHVDVGSADTIYQKSVTAEKYIVIDYFLDETYTGETDLGTIRMTVSYSSPITQGNAWPSDVVSAFFSGSTQSFPAMDGGTLYSWRLDKDGNSIRFTISGITTAELGACNQAMIESGFSQLPFGEAECVNFATASLITDIGYDATTSLMGLELTDTSGIKSTLPTSELDAAFSNYGVSGATYSQVFASYSTSSAKFRFKIKTPDKGYPVSTITVGGTSEAEMNAYIASMSKSGYDMIVDALGENSGIIAFNGTNYCKGEYVLKKTVLTITFTIDPSRPALIEYESWDLAISDMVNSGAISSIHNEIAYTGNGIRYFLNTTKNTLVVSGVDQTGFDSYIESVLDPDGTYQGSYDYYKKGYVTSTSQGTESVPQYLEEIISDKCLAYGALAISFTLVSYLPVNTVSWNSDFIDSALSSSGLSSPSSKFPVIANEDSSRTFSSILFASDAMMQVIVYKGTVADYEAYADELTDSAYGFTYDKLYQRYVNYDCHLGVRMENFISDSDYFVLSLSFDLGFTEPTSAWPKAESFTSFYTEIAEEVASNPLTIEGASYYKKEKGTELSSAALITTFVQDPTVDDDYCKTTMDNYIDTLLANGYVMDKGWTTFSKNVEAVVGGETKTFKLSFSVSSDSYVYDIETGEVIGVGFATMFSYVIKH